MDCSNTLSLFVVEGEPTPAPTAPVSSNEGNTLQLEKITNSSLQDIVIETMLGGKIVYRALSC